MINFLKASPQKFDFKICEGFLMKMGVLHEFNDVVEYYMADFHNRVDLAGVDSFISETNLVDLSNRSVLKTMDRSRRRIEVKRASDISSVLKFLDDNVPHPSKQIQEKKRELHSCPRMGIKNVPLSSLQHDRSRSSNNSIIKRPKVFRLLSKNIEPLEMLFVNEITQAQAQLFPRQVSPMAKR